MYYGLLRDPDLAIIEENEDLIDEDNDKPKKKKSKREALTNKKKGNDPNAPSMDRVPLPEL
jgi:transcription initiation factor TFIID subunit 5